MKILHVCLASFFIDGQAYQENILSKFHKEMGYDVEIISSLHRLDREGKKSSYEQPRYYINEYGIPVTRLAYKKPVKIYEVLRRYINFKENLEKSNPDIIFIHGCQFLDIDIVVNYAKHRNVKIFVDNHADLSNSATNWLSKKVKHGYIWKKCAKKIEPYVVRFYGVLPARVDFLKEIYDIPEEKASLLVMGADDEIVESVKDVKLIDEIRDNLGINRNEFMIVTGGKINHYRPETLNLMQAVINIKEENIKLVIFGSVAENLKNRFEELEKNNKIVYLGWVDSKETYKYMSAADLVVFPGLHSVMWEQAVALGKPCIFRDIEGFHHVDLGGNVVFTKDVTVTGLKKIIENVFYDKKLYNDMLQCAEQEGIKKFSYKHIAEISIE